MSVIRVERRGRQLVLRCVDGIFLARVLGVLFQSHGAIESEGEKGETGPDVPIVVQFETAGDARRAARAIEGGAI